MQDICVDALLRTWWTFTFLCPRNVPEMQEYLPKCDVYITNDSPVPFDLTSVQSEKQFVTNTGFVFIRAARGTQLLREFFRYMNTSEDAALKSGFDDQLRFNTWLEKKFTVFDPISGKPAQSRGAARISAATSGRCLELVNEERGFNFSMVLLHQGLFPNRVAYDDQKVHQTMMLHPVMLHYNWLVGVEAKVRSMREHGHYLDTSL